MPQPSDAFTGFRVGVQMDPLSGVDINADTTFAMMLAAQEYGHHLWHFLPSDVSWWEGSLKAMARPVTVRRKAAQPFDIGPTETLDLSALDVILLRQDPPFDLAYITNTHLLDHVKDRVLVVNDPTAVRNAPEKLLVTQFPDLIPPTLIARDRARIMSFREQYKDIIIKPLFGNGGSGVFHVTPGDENINALLDMFFTQSRDPVMVQRYIPEIRQGDKRIILIDGEPVGAVNRVPKDGEARANLHVGGRAELSPLSPRDLEICAKIGPVLKAQGLIFAGIDVIGPYLTEINVTSPTGVQEIARLNGLTGDGLLEMKLWHVIGEKVAAMRTARDGGP